MADLLRKYKSLYSSTTNTFSTGTGVTITPASVVGLPTDTEITLTFARVNSGGTATPSLMERIIGTISGSNFAVRTSPSSGRGADNSTEQVHTSPVVEMVWNAKDLNDIIAWALTEHAQDGSHKQVTGLTNNVAITQKESGGTARQVAKMNSSNVLELGGTANVTKIKAGSSTTNGHTVPNVADDTVALIAAAQTLTNKTLTTPLIASLYQDSIGGSNLLTMPAATDTLVGKATTDTLTNKRVTKRVTSITSSATPTVNTDNCDVVDITALAAAITSMTTNLSGTPTNKQLLEFEIKDDGTARAITWGASFVAGGVALPTTTVISKILTVLFQYSTANSLNKWRCIGSLQEA